MLPTAGGPDRAVGFGQVSAAGGMNASTSFNSSGGAASSVAMGTGVYRVTFDGLGTEGSVAQVSASGDNSYCKPVAWGPNAGAAQELYVMCFAPGERHRAARLPSRSTIQMGLRI